MFFLCALLPERIQKTAPIFDRAATRKPKRTFSLLVQILKVIATESYKTPRLLGMLQKLRHTVRLAY